MILRTLRAESLDALNKTTTAYFAWAGFLR